MYLSKICIKSKANLEFIESVKNYLGFSCSLRCIATAGYNHGYWPCLFLQEIYLIFYFMLFTLLLMLSVMKSRVCQLSVLYGWATGDGTSSSVKKLDSAPFSAVIITILLLCGRNCSIHWAFLWVDLGLLYTMNPNTEGELEIICLLLFRPLISFRCFIVMFFLGIIKLKLAG